MKFKITPTLNIISLGTLKGPKHIQDTETSAQQKSIIS